MACVTDVSEKLRRRGDEEASWLSCGACGSNARELGWTVKLLLSAVRWRCQEVDATSL